jgi:uncharacterized membrane protein YidH (DUF202 family)
MATWANKISSIKPFFRWVFTVTAAASLMLCLLTALVWMRIIQMPANWPLVWTTTPAAAPGKPVIHYSWQVIFQSDFIGIGRGVVHDFPTQLKPATWPSDGLSKWKEFTVGMQGQVPFGTRLGSRRVGGYQYWGIRRDSFAYNLNASQYIQDWVEIYSPLLLGVLILLPGLYAVQALWKWRRYNAQQRLLNVGHCTVCGYDLRATPELCPECGTRPSEAKIEKLPKMIVLMRWSLRNFMALLILSVAVLPFLFTIAAMLDFENMRSNPINFPSTPASFYGSLIIALCSLLACGALVTWGLTKLHWQISQENQRRTDPKGQ